MTELSCVHTPGRGFCGSCRADLADGPPHLGYPHCSCCLAPEGRTTSLCGYCRAQDHTTEQHVPFDAPGRTPSCRHCDEPLRKGDLYWTHAHGLYRCQQKVTYGHNAAHPDVPCESLGPINQCACLR